MADIQTAQASAVSKPLPANVLAEYRLGQQYRRPNLGRFVITGALSGLLYWAWTRGHFAPTLLVSNVLGIAAAYNGAMYVWRRRFRTRLTAQGIEIRGYFNHFVPWQAVRAIQDDGFGSSQPIEVGYGGRRGTTGRRAKIGVVRIRRFRGKGMLLRAPLVTGWAPDPYFERKLDEMQQLCGQYGTRPIGS